MKAAPDDALTKTPDDASMTAPAEITADRLDLREKEMVNTDWFNEELDIRTKKTDEIVCRFLPEEEGYARRVIEAMNYSVLAGGKRLRPLLIRETAIMYGADPSLYEPFMAALEMIHTYSLVHDDLPAMDNDEYRRGRKTTWNVYGDGMAVIAGDGLLNYAYETALGALKACEECADPAVSFSRVSRALYVLARNAGIYGMVGGQCADIQTQLHPQQTDEEELLYIHSHKTAAMIESGFTIGAILGGAPQEDIDSLAVIAGNVGLAFQIRDDILDVTGTQQDLGKSIGKDAEEGKITYVSLHGLEGAGEKVRELTDEALVLLEKLPLKDRFLPMLLQSMTGRNK